MSNTTNQAAVVMLGPSPEMVGGMSTVVRQLRGGSLAENFALHAVDTSQTAGLLRALRSPIRHARRMWTLQRALRTGKPTIVHIHTCSGFSFYRNCIDLLQARLAGARTILHVHGAAFDAFCARAGFLGRRMINAALTAADRVVVLSDDWKQRLSPFAPQANFAVVPNAVLVPNDPPAPPNDGAPFKFLYLGGGDQRKGIDVLHAAILRLASQQREFTVDMAGPGLHNTTARLRSNGCIRRLGILEGDALTTAIRSADALVMPSRAEGLPMAILEAGAQARPAIATRVGAIPEVITDGKTGLLCEPNDADGLAAAMAAAIADRAATHRMGRALHEHMKNHHAIDVNHRTFAAMYTALLDEYRSAGAAATTLGGWCVHV